MLGGGCGSEPLDGSLRIVGSSNLLPMMSQLAGTFTADNPLVRLDLRMKGSGDGLGLFCDGLAPISGASRRMSEREQEACSAAGVRFVRLRVADDAVVLLTSRDVDVPCLTHRQIYALLGPESIDVSTWDGASSVLEGTGRDLPNLPLTVIGPGAGSGTKRVLVDLLIEPIADARGVPAELRSDYTALPSEQLIADAVAPSDGALGFAGLAAVAAQRERVRLLEIDAGDGCVGPSADNIRGGRYPLGRPLYLYVNLDAARQDPALRVFVDQVLSPAGLAAAGESGSMMLDPGTAARMRSHWSDALAGEQGDRS